MAKQSISVNGQKREFSGTGEMPLLWALRDKLKLKGTKFGCGKGLCGSCTVHVNGAAMRSCITPVAALQKNDQVTTIEGLGEKGDHPLQKAWKKYNVPQCGYCQPGQIMNAAALVKSQKKPSMDQIKSGMGGNICRCGTYNRIQKAIYFAAHGKEAK